MTWTKCRDQMPPDDGFSYITRGGSLFYARIRLGSTLNYLYKDIPNDIEWTPYTSELWDELNK